MSDLPLPTTLFDRADESPDPLFYREPRFVTHVDDATIEALTGVYRSHLAPGADVLDLMSSWISHLPADVTYGRVAGLGMNAEELASNARLSDFAVHDLNEAPMLPYPDASFDAVLNAVSIQYLVRPVEVYRDVARVLRPGGCAIIAMSHRLFPTKAIAAFHQFSRDERARLVAGYLEQAGGFEKPSFLDRSPPNADPLWIVRAIRKEGK